MNEAEIRQLALTALAAIEKTPPLEVRSARSGLVAAVKDAGGCIVTVFRRLPDGTVRMERWADKWDSRHIERFELPPPLQERVQRVLNSL